MLSAAFVAQGERRVFRYGRVVGMTTSTAVKSRPAPSVAAKASMFVATSAAMLGTYYVYDSIAPVAEQLSRELGFSDLQIGMLNGVYSLPNIALIILSGILIDRLGVRSVAMYAAGFCLAGAALTAFGGSFFVMLAGRFLFGVGGETLGLAIMVALSQWFSGRNFAIFFTLNLSLARAGSFMSDWSPSFAKPLYETGWRAPLELAAGFSLMALAATFVYWLLDRSAGAAGFLVSHRAQDRLAWRDMLRFKPGYWMILTICVAFYATILPFRSTFAIKYLQQAHNLSLVEASQLNSYVFLAAIVAGPLFGLLVARWGHHRPLLIFGALLLPLTFLVFMSGIAGVMLPTVLLGISFSLVPAVLWPAVAIVVAPAQRGTAYGLMGMLQNLGLTVSNIAVGLLNDAAGAGAADPRGYDPMLVYFAALSAFGLLCAIRFARLRNSGLDEGAIA